jgi:hypothetical protein
VYSGTLCLPVEETGVQLVSVRILQRITMCFVFVLYVCVHVRVCARVRVFILGNWLVWLWRLMNPVICSQCWRLLRAKSLGHLQKEAWDPRMACASIKSRGRRPRSKPSDWATGAPLWSFLDFRPLTDQVRPTLLGRPRNTLTDTQSETWLGVWLPCGPIKGRSIVSGEMQPLKEPASLGRMGPNPGSEV